MKLPRSIRIFRRFMRRLPRPKFDVGYEPGVWIPMPGGGELPADHYFPDPAGSRGAARAQRFTAQRFRTQRFTAQRFPTLLMSLPPGRRFPWVALYGVAFAEQGFHVVIPRSRGSDDDRAMATVAWLRDQAWFNGRLGLIGPGAVDRPGGLAVLDVPTLVMGPWTDASARRQGLATMFSSESSAWFKGHLVDPAGGPTPPRVRVQVAVGPDTAWREFPAWPPTAIPVAWYPCPGGALAREPPVGDLVVGKVGPALAFSSPALTEPIEVIGPVSAELLTRVTTGVSPLDELVILVRLCDVDERGRSHKVCDGITRVDRGPYPDAPIAVVVAMDSTAHRFLPGHRVRVQITAGAHRRSSARRGVHSIEIRPGSAVVLPAV